MLGGKSKEEKQKEREDRQYRRQLHNSQLQTAQSDDGDAAEILRILSDIDDLPIDPKQDEILGQLVSRLSSTANLTAEQVKSNEWVSEYIMLLYLCRYPKTDGLHGAWRGLAHSDPTADMEPLDPQKRMMIETFVTRGKLALTRSEDAKVMEESTRTVSESVVHDQSGGSGGSGGILGRLRG